MESIVEGFARQLAEGAHRLALWSRREGLQQTFAQLDMAASDWQRRLGDDGAEPVAVAVGNVASFCHLSLALLRLGRPMVCMDGALPLERKLEVCRQLGVATLLHRGETGEPLHDGVRRVDTGVAAAEPPRGTALVKLTSGSTGQPVGVCLSADALAHGIHQIGRGMELSSEERVLLCLPISHSYGFDNGVLSLLALGTPLILEPGIFPASLIKALAQSEATFLPLAPPLVRSLGQTEWPAGLALRRVICAGGVLHDDTAAAFYEASGRSVHNFYGSTETGGISFESSPRDPAALGTVGHPLPGVQVELAADGRLQVTSSANLLGTFGGRVDLPGTASGAVVTGDMGQWTPEGRLRLVGRSGDFLDIGGRKVPAARVEAALRQVPQVRDVAVVGVDDPARGERSVAFVVADAWPLDTSMVPATLIPREMRPIDTLPYSERGKLERQTLRRWASKGRKTSV